MKLKLTKISTKSFVIIFSTINVVTGFAIGSVVTLTALLSPADKDAGGGVWSILLFPLVNGLLGLAGGVFLTSMYNFFAKYLGGVEMEFDSQGS